MRRGGKFIRTVISQPINWRSFNDREIRDTFAYYSSVDLVRQIQSTTGDRVQALQRALAQRIGDNPSFGDDLSLGRVCSSN